jgi:asparagine synthase (glutamine-hydrolysing)
MCGIAGIISSNNKEQLSEILLHNMINKLKHRGPDAQKVVIQDGIGLAHARLSIIDVRATADQPMLDAETSNLIVFNGEIYNYLELREELISFGYKFQTNSDTEVILKAYTHWGVDCLNKFNGMWAFVLYDTKSKLVFAARDRLGIKPFVFGVSEQEDLVFASEAKAIVSNFPEFNKVNEEFLINFVERDFFACFKETFYHRLFNLLPGHYFLVEHGQMPIQKRYWNWTPLIAPNSKSDNVIIDEFSELLRDSIKLRFRSDVPVGACLSGGLDSGTIVGLATDIFNKPIHTFSCVFPNSPDFDESHFINSSVNKFNCIAEFTEPKHDDFIKLVHESVYEQDGPTGGPSILSQRSVMELAGKHVKVVLDGQGADELLGGYHSYFPYSLKSHARHFLHNFSPIRLAKYYNNSLQIKKRTGNSPEGLRNLLRTVRTPPKFYTPNYSETQLGYMLEFEHDYLNTLLLEHVFTNLSNLLHYEDRNSMRFSIESRLPFLDYRLVEFAFSLNHHYKIRGSRTKWLLYNVAKNVLPSDVLNRKDKMGYTTPAHEWFLSGNNLEYFSRFLSTDNIIFSKLSEQMRVYLLKSFDILRNHNKQTITPGISGDINALWRLFTANIWYESV